MRALNTGRLDDRKFKVVKDQTSDGGKKDKQIDRQKDRLIRQKDRQID